MCLRVVDAPWAGWATGVELRSQTVRSPHASSVPCGEADRLEESSAARGRDGLGRHRGRLLRPAPRQRLEIAPQPRFADQETASRYLAGLLLVRTS